MKSMKSKLSILYPLLSIIVILALAFWFIMYQNGDVLYMVQLHSLFLDTPEFFADNLSKPAGFLQWAGCWFIQLCHYSWLAAIAFSFIWSVTFLNMKKAFRVKNEYSPLLLIPIICLLLSIIQQGYWIYYIKMPGFIFRESLGLLVASWLISISQDKIICCKKDVKWFGVLMPLFASILAALLYPYIGYYSILALVCIGLGFLPQMLPALTAFALAVVAPLVGQYLFDTIQGIEIYSVGFPTFESANVSETYLAYPFIVIIISMLAFTQAYRLPELKKNGLKVYTVAIVALVAWSVYFLNDKNYDDENYHAECQAYSAIDEQRWDDALMAIRKVNGKLTRENIILKNIALFNIGEIGSCMYDFDDAGITPNVRDSLHVNMVNLAAPMMYYHHGMMNFSHRWTIENTVEFGSSVNDLKLLALSSLVSGEYAAAQKYLNILTHTMFYKEWAERYLPITSNPKLISRYPELANARELYANIGNHIDSDASLCEKFILHYFSNTQNKDSKYLQEMTLAYAMISKDIQKFWPKYLLYLYLHKGEQIPIHYQEAAYLYGTLEPQTAPNPQTYGITFDKEKVIERYAAFNETTQRLLKSGMSESSIAEYTKSQFGDTFWWTYFFNRGSHYY